MNTITYSDALKRGFKRIEADDKVWFNTYGYEYFIVSKTIGKYSFEWCPGTHKINFYKNEKLYAEEITIEELDYLIKLLS